MRIYVDLGGIELPNGDLLRSAEIIKVDYSYFADDPELIIDKYYHVLLAGPAWHQEWADDPQGPFETAGDALNDLLKQPNG